MKHGTLGAYKNHRCRCDPCKAANTAYMEEYRITLPVEVSELMSPVRHGTHATYSNGCRCDPCREANTAYIREWRKKDKTMPDLPLLNAPPEAWEEHASCAGRDDLVTTFFPEVGGNGNSTPAKAICRGCPVRIDCLDFALRHRIEHGVWGGKSPSERKKLRRRSVA